jgi:hypothetical protein
MNSRPFQNNLFPEIFMLFFSDIQLQRKYTHKTIQKSLSDLRDWNTCTQADTPVRNMQINTDYCYQRAFYDAQIHK